MLADATGRPLVQHVVDRVRNCRRVSDIAVATDDRRIAEALRPFGTRCVMTSPSHTSGTDRVAEVAGAWAGPPPGERAIVVNVQGDEPEIEPDTIDGLIDRLAGGSESMATAATEFPTGADPADPNLVKVVIDQNGRALYFSRAAIPFVRDVSAGPPAARTYLHQGIYAYSRDFLLEFAGWEPTPLEQTEKLEQLRALEHGRSIFVLLTRRAVHGIDTPRQYDEFVQRFKNQKEPPIEAGMSHRPSPIPAT